ncbi:MAG: ABC transporter permease [Lachnospiraceae bacterium]|nr:ABC transporter permease [Lachnospiraceae bacterium]
MQRVLRKRVLRDLKSNFFRYLALGLMIIMAMILVVTIVGSAENLTKGTEDMAEKTNLEDGEFTVFVPLTDEELDEIRAMDIDIQEQFYFDNILDNKDKSTMRIFKIREEINKMQYTSGEAPKHSGEVALEKRFAEVHKLNVGDTIKIAKNEYKITGIGCVSDYDGPYKEISDTSVNSKYFGITFMLDEDYEAFKNAGKVQKSEEYSYAYKLKGNATDEKLKAYLKDIEISAGQVDDKFFKEYWKRTGGVADDLENAVDDFKEATTDIDDALDELGDNNKDITGATDTLFKTYLNQTSNALKSQGLTKDLTEENYASEMDKLIENADSSVVSMSIKSAKKDLDMIKKYKDGIYDYTDAVTEIGDGTGEMKDGVEELDDAVTDAIDDFDFSLSNLTMFLKRTDNPRIFATKNDKSVDISVGLIAGAILLVLMAYVISVFVVHSIESESSIIGTLYSMGVTKNDLIVHYITLPVVVTTLSGLIGGLAAATGFMVPMIADSSYQYFSIPYFSFKVPGYLWIYSVVIPPVISIIVNVLVINKKLNRTALSLIRNEKKEKRNRNINLKGMNFVTAFRIRQMIREMRSSIAVILGMLLALVVFMISVDCFLMCNHLADDYEKDTKYEYMYTLKYPEENVPEDAEPAYAYTFKKGTLGYNFDVTLLGIDEKNPYFDVELTDSKERIAVSTAFAQKFGLKVGDDFIINDEEQELKYAFTVDSIVEYSTGFYLFMDIDIMREMFGQTDDYYNTLFSEKKLDIKPGRLYATTTRHDIVKGASIFSELMMPMVYTLTFASIIIFCVVMYLMMKVMIDRSAQNISLVKVFGYRRKEIKKLYLDGNFYIIAIGAAICIPLAKLIMNASFPYMISNVNCGMNLKAPVYFFFIVYGVIVLLYFLINALLVRKLEKYTPAEILKNRE